MTREEAIKSALKFLVRKQQEQGSWGYADNDDTHEVSWDEIIRWVDQRSCRNSISMESVLEILDDYAEDIESGNWGTAYSKARTSMCDLPSVTPQPKIGHWIIHSDDLFPSESTQECSECHEHQPLDWRHSDNYCPNCGIKMEVEG